MKNTASKYHIFNDEKTKILHFAEFFFSTLYGKSKKDYNSPFNSIPSAAMSLRTWLEAQPIRDWYYFDQKSLAYS